MHPLDIHAGGRETYPSSDFRWPGGKRLAVFFRVSFEWWSDDKWPGIGPMGNPLRQGFPDLNAIGWAEYGHRRGIFRILDVLARQGIKATINVSGIMAERYPDTVRMIVDEGHEVVAHSYAMDIVPIYLSEEEERANIARTTELIAARHRRDAARLDQPALDAERAHAAAAGGSRLRLARRHAQRRSALSGRVPGTLDRRLSQQHRGQRPAALHAPRQRAARDDRAVRGLARCRAHARDERGARRSGNPRSRVRPPAGRGGLRAHHRNRQGGRRRVDRHALGSGRSLTRLAGARAGAARAAG